MRLQPTFLLLACLLLGAATVRAADAVSDGLVALGAPLTRALGLLGTPYRPGGTRPDTGLDCSGLVRYVYKETAGIDLPHNARELSRNGMPVEPGELRPGDLVFFNTLKRPFSHVGIYTGGGKFLHASSRRDRRVTVSDMGSRYWSERYDGARRIPLPAR